jgi:U3 small nucleolar RNA-associated protein 6
MLTRPAHWAAEAPTLELFAEIARAIRTYPAPDALKDVLLDHLYALLSAALPDSADARRMHATRTLDAFADGPSSDGADVPGEADAAGLDSEPFIDALRAANDELRAAAQAAGAASDTARVYAAFVADWCARRIDDNLVRPRPPAAPAR